MNTTHSHSQRHATLTSLVCGVLFGLSANSYAVSPQSLAQSPLFLVTSAKPLVMLNLSNDHQLFYKAYDDWSDINGDSSLDITYNHSIDYYGYFDSYKCYVYDTTDLRFEPDSITDDKYCSGASDWSGNFLNWASMTRMDSVKKILYGGTRSTDNASTTVLERSYIPGDAHSFAKYFATTTAEMQLLTPFNALEITLCNTTYDAGDASSTDDVSENITSPPLIRVAAGNFALWAANERWQCQWNGNSEPGQGAYNGNDPDVSGLDASSTNPDWTSDKLGEGDYIARVQVCVSTDLSGKEDCKAYPDGNLKPVGLLQEYGDDSQILFGLMTGSFQHNKSGGVLRKNVSAITDEINTDSDGTFKTAPGTGNIINNLDALRVSGYEHNPGYYNIADNCSWGLNTFTNGNCSNWGNPQSEIYLESLRYFAGASANASFTSDDSSYIDNFISSSWTDPLSNDNYCASVNIIQFNASVISYDDEFSGTSDLNDLTDLDTFTDAVGSTEGINGNDFFIGEGTTASTTDGLCTAKTLTGLSDASGLCPEAPRLEGSYAIAGLANYSHTTSLRDDLVDINNDEAEIKAKTYGVTLSPAIPKIEVPIPGTTDVVTILPACRNQDISGNCAIVDFKVVEPHTVDNDGTATGKFYVNWEDSEQGGDYDQDMHGSLSYSATSSQIEVTTLVFDESTSYPMGFGYVISGTEQDGFHAHSGIFDFTYDDDTGVTDCETACNVSDGASTATYTIGASSGSLLKDPLWYAAKWGGFEEEEDANKRPDSTNAPNDIPDQSYEWDRNADGTPDTYFFSTNPAQLARSLSSAFLSISEEQSSASSTAANSQRADVGSYIFQAQFNSEDWSGKLLKYSVNGSTGALTLDTSWGTNGSGDAGDTLIESNRTILTYNPNKTDTSDDGHGFVWTSLTDAQKASLNYDPVNDTTDALGEDRLDYLRGDRSAELQNGGSFRNRSRVLGDIINSSPVYVGEPSYLYPDNLEATGIETYSAFKARMGALNSDSGRTAMLYVGGNDGMLHGFDASTGVERLAYVPYGVYPKLSELTSLDYTHQYYVDGSPSVGDAVFSDDDWHTVLLGSLNAGGQSIYALDVTNPANFAEDSASQTVLWEVSQNTVTGTDVNGDPETGFSELGFTFARPAIVKNYNGDWIGVFGNGYAGTSGHAVLYLVNLENGILIQAITVDDSGNNGLSTASPIDLNGDEKIDAIYAGDLKGNMWKFVPDSNGEWQTAFSDSPLFTAPADSSGYSQPITARPEVGLHPDGLPGVIVYFGTGKYFETGDNVGVAGNVQRFYGIWDPWGPSETSIPSVSIDDGNLLRQCVTDGSTAGTCVANEATSTGEVLQNYEVRFISDNSINAWDWDESLGKMGWYIDLPELGEKQVTNSILRAGRIIFVTVVPSDHSCSDGGESWLMELDAGDGSAMDIAVFDLNNDGNFDENDMKGFDSDGDGEDDTYLIPGGKRSDEGIIQPPSILTNTDEGVEYKYSSGSTGNIEMTTENPAGYAKGRKSWIQIK